MDLRTAGQPTVNNRLRLGRAVTICGALMSYHVTTSARYEWTKRWATRCARGWPAVDPYRAWLGAGRGCSRSATRYVTRLEDDREQRAAQALRRRVVPPSGGCTSGCLSGWTR